jgi:hypothetical protein
VTKTAADGICELFFHGPPYKSPDHDFTKVFAYYGRARTPVAPAAATPEPGAALVLIHGWAGHAMRSWVAEANRRGYHAISFSTNGLLGDSQHAVPEPYRGPGDGNTGPWKGDFPFLPPRDEPPHHRWMYHAVANTLRAHSLLRSFSEVDPARTGAWGISWGGHFACLAAALDSRFRVVCTQHGSGYLHENSAWTADLDAMAAEHPDLRETWLGLWDPSRYLPAAQMPLFFFNGHNDFFYPLDSWTKTRRLALHPASDAGVAIDFPHGHSWGKKSAAIWQVLGHHLQGQPPLPRMETPHIDGRRVVVDVAGLDVIQRPLLHYTMGAANRNDTRVWTTLPLSAETNGRIVGMAPPADARAWFITASDTADARHYQNLISSAVAHRPG